MVSLGDLDAVGEDLDGEGVVGNFLSICIQFCRGWKWSRSHPLCGVPCGGGQDRFEVRKTESKKRQNWGDKEWGERHNESDN